MTMIKTKAFTKLSRVVLAATFLSVPTAIAGLSAAHATAGPGQTVHLNGEGRRACRALKAQPATYWDAKVRGRYLDSYAGTDRFTVRYCFETKSQCLNFVGGFRHIVQNVETINYARCEPR